MKLFQLKRLNEMICPICGLNVCKCDSEEEEVEYKGKTITIGKHNDKTDHHYDPEELAMGVEDELEHTSGDKRVAKAIAKDHLSEIPKYYSRTRKMRIRTHGPESFKVWSEKK